MLKQHYVSYLQKLSPQQMQLMKLIQMPTPSYSLNNRTKTRTGRKSCLWKLEKEKVKAEQDELMTLYRQ